MRTDRGTNKDGTDLARVSAITPSATLAVDAKAKACRPPGRTSSSSVPASPTSPPPAHIVEAAVEAARDPRNHHYTPTPGLPELREAIADKTIRDSGYQVDAAQVVVTNGGKHAVYNTMAALLDPGDEVLLPAPYWTTYPSRRLAGGVPVVVHRRHVRVQGDRRRTRGGTHRAHQGARVRLTVEPDGRCLPPGDDHRGSAGGPSSGASGWSPTRSTSTSPTTDGKGTRCRCWCPIWPTCLRRAQRGGQDLRHDGLAGGLDRVPTEPGRRLR